MLWAGTSDVCKSLVVAEKKEVGDGVCRLDGTIGDGFYSVFEPSICCVE